MKAVNFFVNKNAQCGGIYDDAQQQKIVERLQKDNPGALIEVFGQDITGIHPLGPLTLEQTNDHRARLDRARKRTE